MANESCLKMLDSFPGRAEKIQTARQAVLLQAYATHPNRFVRKPPAPPILAQTGVDQPTAGKNTLEVAAETTISTPLDTWGPPKIDAMNPSEIANELTVARDARPT